MVGFGVFFVSLAGDECSKNKRNREKNNQNIIFIICQCFSQLYRDFFLLAELVFLEREILRKSKTFFFGIFGTVSFFFHLNFLPKFKLF